MLFTIYRKARYFTIFRGFDVDSLWITSKIVTGTDLYGRWG
jgi:hypothetical protein